MCSAIFWVAKYSYYTCPLTTRGQADSDKEQREQHSRRQREKDHRGKDDERKRQRHHYDFDKFMRHKEETRWGKGYCHDRAKKDGHHHGFCYCPDSGDKLVKDDREDLGNRKERLRNKVSEKVSMRWVKVTINMFTCEILFNILMPYN